MTLRHFHIFVTVVKCGKMRAAAKELFIAQPAVSQAISELEHHYNIVLFERLSRKLYITPAGEQFYFYASRILSLCDELEQQMNHSMESTKIKVGATITVGTCILNCLLNEYRRIYPNVEIQVYIHDPNTLGKMLIRNDLDIALVENFPHNIDELISEAFLDDTMILVCSPEHPFAKTGSATLEEISKENYIAREPGETKELFVELMEEHNYSLKCAWFCNNSETTKQAVIDNYGVTVISRRIVSKELQNGSLLEIDIKDHTLPRKFKLVYHKHKYFSDPLHELVDICKNLEVILP